MRKALFIFILAIGACFAQRVTEVKLGRTTIKDDGTNLTIVGRNLVSAMLACVGTPGSTIGPYRSLCVTTAGAVYACSNSAGCTASGDWAAQGGGGGGTATVAGYTTVPFADPPTIACASNTACSVTLTLTNNIASTYTIDTSGITNSGHPILTLQIKENGTGGFTFAWPTNVLNHGVIATSANAINVQTFVWDGSNFQALGALLTSGISPDQVCIAGSTSGTACLQAPATSGANNSLPPNAGTLPAISGTPTAGHCASWLSATQVQDSGGTCGGGSGTVGTGVSAYQNASYTTTANANTPLPFDTNEFDDYSGAVHSTSSNTTRFTANATGRWLAICSMATGSSPGSNTYFAINFRVTVSGGGSSTTYQGNIAPWVSGNASDAVTASRVFQMNSGDYMECLYYTTLATPLLVGLGNNTGQLIRQF